MNYNPYNILFIKTSNYNIKPINSEEAYKVRHPVLREGKPIESCVFDGDDFETTIHLGLYYKTKLVGVCSFLKNNHDAISETAQYQLRGMAVLEKYQGKGLGNSILDYGENLLKKKDSQIIWCNAREVAVYFYQKCGYSIIGQPFNIKYIGMHYIMQKKILK
ncbi:GNAT family N-acetyltransferase [Flaviramulus aquimarinus]|uniref:GNAT family N-acetyltransferase n=1 Tax=Flaviramulus aquimarinus TaxID=1170456 RepID=A0ABP9EV63_9FLAO